MAEWTGVRGKRVVITGATNGIGLAAATQLATRGAELTILARSPQRAQAAVAQIGRASGASQPIDVLSVDLASQVSIRRVADEILARYPRIDVLINNAGALYATRQLTTDGIELTWAVNHLAPFLLTTLLLDRLISSAPARVITTSSGAHHGATIPFDDLAADRSYANFGYRRYGESKLANIVFTTELARRLQGTQVTANCFHPGFVATGFSRNNGGLLGFIMPIAQRFARSPEKGAETLVWLAEAPQLVNETGGYWVDQRRRHPSRAAQDEATARRLWQVSERQTEPTPAATP